MTKQGLRVVHLMLALIALWFITPTLANAQVTVTQVRVTIAGTSVGGTTAEYCDSTTTGTLGHACLTVWTLPVGGQHLNAGETLILTQTGAVPGNATAANFDTSDRVTANGATACNSGNACTVTIELNTGAGLAVVENAIACDALDNCNNDDFSLTHLEGMDWAQVHSEASFTLKTGYADDAHGGKASFPSPWQGGVTFFNGNGLAADGTCPNLDGAAGNCYDAGALLITAQAVTPPPGCVIPSSETIISGTSWNKFNAPAGSVVWIHAHIGTPSGISTTTKTTVDFTGVTFVLNGKTYNLPNGHIVFDPSASSTATTVRSAAGWTTTLNPNNLSDEIFFDGNAVPIDPNITGGGKADLSFTTTSSSTTLAFPWQWSAAVYTTWLGDAAANIEPVHASEHAGAPLNKTQESFLIQGPRGGGGSNFTGSWSATGHGNCQ